MSIRFNAGNREILLAPNIYVLGCGIGLFNISITVCIKHSVYKLVNSSIY